jgi:hypothetical protein
MTTRPELTAADGTPEEPLPDLPALTAREDDHRWMNRALLAESRLAALRTAYEPTSNQKTEK